MIRYALALCFVVAPLGLDLPLWAHAGHSHEAGSEPKPPAPVGPEERARLDEVAALYQRELASLFKRSCVDCHSKLTSYPWYYRVPGVKQLIDSDIAEARSHLDLTDGFPFISHANPQEDIRAIQRVLQDGSMPPLRYVIMHKGSAIDKADQARVQRWAEEALTILAAPERAR